MHMISDVLHAQVALGLDGNLSFDDPMNITEEQLLTQFGDANGAEVLSFLAGKPLRELQSARTAMLSDTDWWVLPDRNPTQAQLTYRQALRDITDTYASLEEAVWPTKPTEDTP